MRKIRVMIVEDSAVVRLLLQYIIGSDDRFEIACLAETAEEALAALERVKPDVISLDIRLPGMNGLDATLHIMSSNPTPIVVVAASVEGSELNIAMNALRAGAVAVVEKPVGTSHEDYETVAKHLCNQLAIMSQVKVVKQARRGLNFGSPAPVAAPPPPPPPRQAMPVMVEAVGLVASTGGPNALSRVLSELPKSFAAPIFLVQHITPSFLDGFVSWLDGLTPLKVKIADVGETPCPGMVYLPPVDRHLEIRQGRLWHSRAEEVCNQRPSGSVLFHSMAREYGSLAVGALLTGMGADGAEGLLAMRKAGAYTIAEDASTCVVYGMPAAAAEMGAACEILPLPSVARRLVELVDARRREART